MEFYTRILSLITVTLCFVSCEVNGKTYENASQLKTALLANYDPWLVPKSNQSETMVITVGLSVYSIVDIDVLSGIITTVASLSLNWTDERMVWNSSDYGGIDKVKFPQDAIWTPTIVSSKGIGVGSIGDKWMKATYRSDGSVVWNPPVLFKTSCTFNVRYWPFDKQICYNSVFVYEEDKSEVILQARQSNIDTTYLLPNQEWYVEETFAINSQYPYISEVSFGLKLKRQALFYIYTIMFPLVALNIMNCLAFLLPSESGERIGYTVTIMLSVIVFFLLVGDHVPKTSAPLPVICAQLVLTLVVGILCMVASILSLCVYYREGNVPETSWGLTLVRFVSKFSCQTKDPVEEPRDESGSTDERSVRSDNRVRLFKTKVGPPVNTVKDHPDVPIPDSFLVEEPHKDHVTWKEVGRTLDKVLFVAFLLTTTILSMVFSLYLFTMSTYPKN